MRIKKTRVYKFDELSDKAKETAIQVLADINVNYDWWDSTYDDAERVYLKLTEFNIDRASYCKGSFIRSADDTATAILKEHGPNCETFKTAKKFLQESADLLIEYPVELDSEGYDKNESARDDAQTELNKEFLKSILEDYRIILQKEYEHLISEKAIIETIEANEYEFTEDGKLA